MSFSRFPQTFVLLLCCAMQLGPWVSELSRGAVPWGWEFAFCFCCLPLCLCVCAWHLLQNDILDITVPWNFAAALWKIHLASIQIGLSLCGEILKVGWVCKVLCAVSFRSNNEHQDQCAGCVLERTSKGPHMVSLLAKQFKDKLLGAPPSEYSTLLTRFLPGIWERKEGVERRCWVLEAGTGRH